LTTDSTPAEEAAMSGPKPSDFANGTWLGGAEQGDVADHPQGEPHERQLAGAGRLQRRELADGGRVR